MQPLKALPFVLLAAPALAHPGHMAESAGHSHWLAIAALGGAVFVTVAAVARRNIRRRRKAPLLD